MQGRHLSRAEHISPYGNNREQKPQKIMNFYRVLHIFNICHFTVWCTLFTTFIDIL